MSFKYQPAPDPTKKRAQPQPVYTCRGGGICPRSTFERRNNKTPCDQCITEPEKQ